MEGETDRQMQNTVGGADDSFVQVDLQTNYYWTLLALNNINRMNWTSKPWLLEHKQK